MAHLGPLKVVSHASTSKQSSTQQQRVHLHPSLFKANKLAAGDMLVLIPALTAEELSSKLAIEAKQGKDERRRFALGIAWPAFSLEAGEMSASPALLDGIAETGDLVLLAPLAKSGLKVAEASSVAVEVLDEDKAEQSRDGYFLAYVKQLLLDLGHVQQGQRVEVKYGGNVKRILVKAKANTKADVFALSSATTISYRQRSLAEERPVLANGIHEPPHSHQLLQPINEVGYDDVGGLDTEIQQIRELVELPLTCPDLYKHFGLQPPHGILLHGPPGTGKTLLASAIASSLDVSLFSIAGPSLSSPFHGETEQRLREIFEAAAKTDKGSIIVIDEVDALAPKREDSGEVERRVVATLLTLMDGLDKKAGAGDAARVMVIAATNRPNAIDPALRRPGRFDREIEIGVPNVDARLAILRVLFRRSPHDLSAITLQSIASRTHGFVGADLASLVHTASVNAIRRSLLPSSSTAVGDMRLSEADIEAALLVTRPSAMREVFIEAPKVRWSDVGGQEQVKRRLKESVEWPLRHPETFKRLGIRPPAGVLLYGPPGCSKTLIARALATEAGLNFIAIKGPEIFNKYVGESERAVREIFRKARAAAPSILFLDEVDAIASSRDASDSTSTADRVLTSLLTEMDGVEELNGVTVLAATNRPFVLDPALLRPGRLDRILYVGPPDLEARDAIFRINLQRMAVEPAVDAYELAHMTEGCSGAEITSICQDAALKAMDEDRDAQFVSREHFLSAARSIRRRITPGVLEALEAWRDQAGVAAS